mgnify:FL=1
MATALKNPAVIERLNKQGIESEVLTNAQFAKILTESDKQMADVVKKSGAKVQ